MYHRELFEILLQGRRLRLIDEISILIDGIGRQVGWTRMSRRTRRRRWIVAIAQRTSLEEKGVSFLDRETRATKDETFTEKDQRAINNIVHRYFVALFTHSKKDDLT